MLLKYYGLGELNKKVKIWKQKCRAEPAIIEEGETFVPPSFHTAYSDR